MENMYCRYYTFPIKNYERIYLKISKYNYMNYYEYKYHMHLNIYSIASRRTNVSNIIVTTCQFL